MARHSNEYVIQELYRLGTILADRVDAEVDCKVWASKRIGKLA